MVGGVYVNKYKTLLFDLDDTLFDFQATEDMALQKLFHAYQLELTPQIKADYKKINDQLWKAYEEDQMDRDEVVNTRFSRLFELYGMQVNGVELQSSYINYLSEGHHLIPGAVELIQSLHTQYDLYVVTNGSSFSQFRRLEDSGLAPYFLNVFVSEDTGYQKPMKEFFDHVFSQIKNFKHDDALIIGDSLTADITGGWRAGIDTCWVNLQGKENHSEVIPTYEITRLDELHTILG